MKKIYLFIISILVIALNLSAQNFQWARNPGIDWGQRVVADNLGNSYATGGFPNNRIGVAKHGLNGSPKFSFVITSSPGAGGFGIALDGSATKNIFVTGCFVGTNDFNPAAGVNNLTSTGIISAFVAKYDSLGNYVWAFPLRSGGQNYNYDVITDASGNVYVTGEMLGGGNTDFDPSAGVANLTGNGAFLAKYDNNGLYQWAFKIGINPTCGRALTIDATGDIYLFGRADSGTDLDPGAGVATVSAINNFFVAKYNASGQYISHFDLSASPPNQLSYDISLDASNNIYITSVLNGTVDFDPSASVANLTSAGGQDAFVAKYNSSYQYQWAFKIGGANGETGAGIANDAAGNVYVTGDLATNGIDFDPSAGTATLALIGTAGSSNAFVASYSSGGLYKWAFNIGMNSTNNGSSGSGICTYNPSSALIVSGMFDTPGIDFNPSAATATLAGISGYNSFVAKYDQCSTPSQPVSITGNNSICSGSANTYSVAVVSGATSYTWSLPGGWSGSSSTNIINTTAGLTSGNVTVTANNICGSSTAQTLSVTVNTPPATPGTITGSVTICPGNTPSYSVAPVSGATSYTWNLPGGWTGSSATNMINTTASATSGNVTVTATNSCGTSAAQTLSVTVNTTPATPGTISGLASMCVGAGASNYSVASVAGATSYTWSLPGGWSGASATNIISATPGTTGIFTVTASNSCGTSSQRTLNVTVNPLPTITVNSGTICSGKSFTMVPSGASTYTFQGGSATVSPLTNTSYTVTGTSAAGCVSAGPATSNVTVTASPTIAVNSGSICSGNPFTMIPSGASTYTFQGGSATVSPGTTTSYTVIGTSVQGCVSSSPATSNVTVSPTPTISVAGGAICPGNSFTLSPSGASTYTFSSGPVVSPTTTTSYSVTGTSAAGCAALQAVATVTVASTLTVTISGSNVVCNGNAVSLTAGGATSYTWNTSATTTSISPTPSVNTTYSVIGASGSCSNTAMFSVTVNPTPTVSAVTSSSLICVGQSATLTASGASTYTFNPGGAGTSITVSPTVTATYTVTGTNASGCTNVTTITQNVSGCVGINQITVSGNEINIYPNPTTGILNVHGASGSVIHIYNLLGELVLSSQLQTNNTELNLSELTSGIYFVRIGSVTKKIIKE